MPEHTPESDREILLTCDGKGRQAKEEALNRLLGGGRAAEDRWNKLREVALANGLDSLTSCIAEALQLKRENVALRRRLEESK